MQHIIWVSPGFAANESDSQCIPPQQLLAQALSTSKQLQLHIISLHYPHTHFPYKWHGITVYPCYTDGPFQKLSIWYRAFRKLRQLLRQYPQALVHSFWMNDACLLAQLATRRHSKRHIVTLMGQDARPSNRYLPFINKKSLYTIALSRFHADQYRTSTGYTAKAIIPWALPPIPTPNAPRPYHLIAIGNLIPLKQFEQFVTLVQAVKPHFPNVKALLVGAGPQLSQLKKQAVNLGIHQNLSFTGALARPQVMALLAQSQVLVHPSSYESFGFVVLEALQQGAAVVAYPVGIAAELAEVQLAHNFTELVRTTVQILASSPSKKLPERFTLEQLQRNYFRIYGF